MTGNRDRIARYRQLQAWYREHQLQVADAGIGVNGTPVGSMLPAAAVDERPDLNFLTPQAFAHAQRRIREVREGGGTLDEDRLRRNLLSSMPLCFNIFGSLGTHPAFAALLRATGIGPDAVVVDEVVCEWAPRPAADHLGDRSAFDAFVRYRTDAGAPRFVGVETKYTETFSPTEYERAEYLRVTRESGWFKPGAETVLRASATNQLWRTVMLAASTEGTSKFGLGSVLVLTLAEDEAAAACVAVVQSQLVDEGRLRHLTYEALAEACDSTGDPDLRAWATRFRIRYLDADQLSDRETELDGPRFDKSLTWPDREFTPTDYVCGRELTEALSWGLASRLVRRYPQLRITESHPGGGTYDCLNIEGKKDAGVGIQLNRFGSGFVSSSAVPNWSWRGIWNELAATDFRFGVELIGYHAGLPPDSGTPEAQPHTVAYRLIALVLMSNLGGQTWRASYDFGGETWTGESVPSWTPERRGSWLLHREGEPILAIDCETGTAVRADGEQLDLMATYAKDRRIAALLPVVLGSFVS